MNCLKSAFIITIIAASFMLGAGEPFPLRILKGAFELEGHRIEVTFYCDEPNYTGEEIAKYAFTRPDGTLFLRKQGCYIRKVIINEPKSGKIIQQQTFPQSKEFDLLHPVDDELTSMDLNFDGYPDIMLSHSCGARNSSRHVYLYNPQTKHYDFDNLKGNFELEGAMIMTEPESKKIIALWSIGGKEYVVTLYQWQSGQLIKFPDTVKYHIGN
jgi:hypothetical protein